MDYALPVLFALFAWWFSTGAVLYVVGLPKRSYALSMLLASAVGAAALYALAASSADGSVSGAYVAFTAALFVWGWHELSFLTGTVTGPRTSGLPVEPDERAPLWAAVETVIYHEFAIFITIAAAVALTWGGVNQVGTWTLLILWVMRLSAKFNVYLGVPNLTEEFLPEHLVYLKSYFCRRPMNLLFPVSVTAATALTGLLIVLAALPAASEFEVTGYTLLASLAALGVIEHWFLVLPLPVTELWRWGMASRETPDARPAKPSKNVPAAAEKAVAAAQ